MFRLLLGGQPSKLTSEQIKDPFLRRVEFALKRENYHAAIAFLTSAIELLPNDFDLYFQRAQVCHYGLCDFGRALKDYRLILQSLSNEEDQPLARQCRLAITEMMNYEPPERHQLRG